jgi:signal transduction histidine kinase
MSDMLDMRTDRRRLRTFLVFDLITVLIGVVFILTVWWLVLPSPWLLVLAAMVGASGLIMLGAVRPLRAGRLEPAVRWLAVANWSVALGSTAIAVFSWPMMVLAALLPAVISLPYVSGTRLRVYLAISLATSVGVAMLGVLQDFSGLTADLPVWVTQAVVIVFTPFLCGMIAQLSLENSEHLNAALLRAQAVNERLRESEAALGRQADELRASRARVVAATDRERRRIERDIHDGAQQRLVALSVRLAMARELVENDPGRAAELLESMRTEIKAAQQELNLLAQGVYPPVLTEHGLGAALLSAVDRTPNPVELAISDVGRHPRDLEAAIYFCCVEALQNVAKHAGPSAVVTVRLSLTGDDQIEFEVADNGQGFAAPAGRGNGFTNMRDRIGAAGGVVEVVSELGRGTRVIGRVPTSRPQAPQSRIEPTPPDNRSVELGHRDGLRPRPAGPALEGVLDHERL